MSILACCALIHMITRTFRRSYKSGKFTTLSSAPIAQLVECLLRGTGGHGFDPGPRHTKVVKNGTSCSSLGTQTYGVGLIMSSVWDMILQCGSTIKVSIELPVATRHRRDMTAKLLKATLNPNTHTFTTLENKMGRLSPLVAGHSFMLLDVTCS